MSDLTNMSEKQLDAIIKQAQREKRRLRLKKQGPPRKQNKVPKIQTTTKPAAMAERGKKRFPPLRERAPTVVPTMSRVNSAGVKTYARALPSRMAALKQKGYTFQGRKYTANITNQSAMFNYIYALRGVQHKRSGSSILSEWHQYIEQLEGEGVTMAKKLFFGDVMVLKDGEPRRVNLATFDLPAVEMPATLSDRWTKKDESMFLLAFLLEVTEFQYDSSDANDIDITGDVNFTTYDADLKSPLKSVKMKGVRMLYHHLKELNAKQRVTDGGDEDVGLTDYEDGAGPPSSDQVIPPHLNITLCC